MGLYVRGRLGGAIDILLSPRELESETAVEVRKHVWPKPYIVCTYENQTNLNRDTQYVTVITGISYIGFLLVLWC